MRIAYLEQNPTASYTIFFVHGNSTSSGTWKKQFSSELLSPYRLMAIDLPAHGDSGASADPEKEYTLAGIASILTEVVNQLITGPYILCGVSLGTNIIAEMIPFGIEPKGILFAGSCIAGEGLGLDKIALPGADLSVFFSDEVNEDAVTKYRSITSLSQYADDQQEFLHDFSRVQAPFRSNFMKSIANGNFGDEIAIVNSTVYPLAWVFGGDEKVAYPDYLDEVDVPKWKGRVFKIPGASHLVNIDQPEAFNTLLAAFADDSFGKTL